jgi:hypothetical protein
MNILRSLCGTGVICFLLQLSTSAVEKITAFESAKPWWPEHPAWGEQMQRNLQAARTKVLSRLGYLPDSMFRELVSRELLATRLDPAERTILMKLNQMGCQPRVGTEERSDRLHHVVSIDLSGRSGHFLSVELVQSFASNVDDRVAILLNGLPHLRAVFAFDTKLTNVGVLEILKLPNLEALWFPPLATGEVFPQVASCPKLRWLSLIPVHATPQELSTLKDAPCLQALFVDRPIDPSGLAKQLAQSKSLRLLVVDTTVVNIESKK